MVEHLIQAWRACLVCIALAISACANFNAVDKPLPHWTPELNRQTKERIVGDRSPELLVLVAFSGGGTRAAAFAYGVLQELAATKIATEKGLQPLLHEVDVISSVSGGSFTSAYYGLRGDRIFEEFEDRFLRKNVEGALFWQVFRPISWFRLLSSKYGRADLAAEYYDKNVFNAATFADLQRPDAPLVVINATDLATGIRFPFTRETFDLICADFGQFPLARAVAASSAVPVVFTPVTIKSYAGSCGFTAPAWLGEALKDETLTTRKVEARGLEGYLDRKKRPWLHLVDGGISDNLGLRSFYSAVSLMGDPRAAFDQLGHPDVRHILIILVNAHAKERTGWALERAAPSLLEVIGSVTADQIDRYSLDTIDIVRSAFARWTEKISKPERPVTFNFVEVSFDAVRDDAQRRYLNNIGTNFNLNDEQVDRLISNARKVLHGSAEFQAFLDHNWSHGDRPSLQSSGGAENY
jgi:NTE family protein